MKTRISWRSFFCLVFKKLWVGDCGRLGLRAIASAGDCDCGYTNKTDDSGLKQLLSDFNRPVISQSAPNQESLIFEGGEQLDF
jgi:hypothetical protein